MLTFRQKAYLNIQIKENFLKKSLHFVQKVNLNISKFTFTHKVSLLFHKS